MSEPATEPAAEPAAEPAEKKARTEEPESYYKIIEGVKYDRALLSQIEAFAADGQVSSPEAKLLFKEAQDGRGITDIERQTLEYGMKTYKFTAKAEEELKKQLAGEKLQSYYKQIDGVKYDRGLLEKAEGATKTGGVISLAEAKDLWEDAQDGKGVTETEKATLQYTLTTFKYTDRAAAFMKEVLGLGRTPSYYKQIDGVKYDRELLEAAEAFTKTGGVISYAEAKELWENAQDGPGVTQCERRTLEFAMTKFKLTDKATAFMKESLGLGSRPSYYRQIDGVRYDRELLEQVEASTKTGGVVSEEEALKLWESAEDGKGVTPCERETLEYALKIFKFTDKATEVLKGKLAA